MGQHPEIKAEVWLAIGNTLQSFHTVTEKAGQHRQTHAASRGFCLQHHIVQSSVDREIRERRCFHPGWKSFDIVPAYPPCRPLPKMTL